MKKMEESKKVAEASASTSKLGAASSSSSAVQEAMTKPTSVLNQDAVEGQQGQPSSTNRLKRVLRSAGVQEANVHFIADALAREEIDAEVLGECAHQDLMGVPGLTSNVVILIRKHFQSLAKSTTCHYRAHPPTHFCCPITRDLFRDPVFAEDGETVSLLAFLLFAFINALVHHLILYLF